MSQVESQDSGGLAPQYQNYQRQKCFIAYTEKTEWAEDLLSACEEVVSKPEFNLELDYARKHFVPDVTLREKALELIANARYGIYDLSYWWDEQERKWKMPCNVFIELGIAITLNRPTLLLRNAKNRELDFPECLKGLESQILEFSGYTTLKRELEKFLPEWINTPPKKNWWSHSCFFGGKICEYRIVHPQVKPSAQKSISCHISDGTDRDRSDFRGVIKDVFERFNNLTYTYLDSLSMTEGYQFHLCSQCQTVRSTSFAIYRITPNTPVDTFIAIGISLALEMQFKYAIPKILMAENLENIPSLLDGYEVVIAHNDKQRKKELQKVIPFVLQKIRQTVWNSKPLPFEWKELLNDENPIDEDLLRADIAPNEIHIRVANIISANAATIVKVAVAKSLLYSDLTRPGGNMYTTRRYNACLRDLDYYLRYAAYAMLAQDPSILDERVLNGLKETLNSLGVPVSSTVLAIQTMKQVTASLVGDDAGKEMEVYFDYICSGLS